MAQNKSIELPDGRIIQFGHVENHLCQGCGADLSKDQADYILLYARKGSPQAFFPFCLRCWNGKMPKDPRTSLRR